jgi:Protein of unknown function (DUF2877)
MDVKARRIGAFAATQLPEGPCPVRLLAQFDRHVYLDVKSANGGPLLVLTGPNEPLGPMNLALCAWPDWGDLPPQAEGRLQGQEIVLPGLRIALDEMQIWPSATPRLDGPQIRMFLGHLIMAARARRHHSPLLETVLADPETRAMPECDLGRLAAGFMYGDTAAIFDGAAQMAGLGAGLTPSGDDFLCGVMTMLWATWPSPENAASAILAAATGRTTTLSHAFMTAAAHGHVSVAWKDLLLCCERRNLHSNLQQSLDAVLAHGHSSGADTLAGFIWAGLLQPLPTAE